MPASFNEKRLTPTIKQAFAEYVREDVISAGWWYNNVPAYCSAYSLCESLVTVLSVEQDYLFDYAMMETTLAFQVIGYDDVFYWKHAEKEECPF